MTSERACRIVSYRVFRFYIACFHMLSHSLHTLTHAATVCGLVKLTCQSLDAGDYAEMDRSIGRLAYVAGLCLGRGVKMKYPLRELEFPLEALNNLNNYKINIIFNRLPSS